MAYKQRGLDSSQEQDQARIVRDTRTLGMRISDTLKNRVSLSIVMLAFACTSFVVGYVSELVLIIGFFAFLYGYTQKRTLPFRLPLVSHQKDFNDLLPGNNKPRMARGIYYFGNEIKTSNELWFSNEDMRTHVLIFGSTGSGKTQALLSITYNALLQASGFIYVDGKGDNSLYASVFSMVRSMGREDDLLLINFMTGARDVIGPQESRLSNTLNPFGSGSSSMLSNLVVSLMGTSKGGSGDADMWKGRAIGFVESLMKVLVAMRDAGHILLDANTIRNYFHLPKLESITLDKLFPRDGMESVSLENFPPSILEPLMNYVLTLPGFKKESKGKQVSQVFEQHGYITMQLVRIFTSLADTYGHILRIRLPEVDLTDVVLNRRILCVLLPALEKSPEELANLGKIIIATLKSMMAAGLGDSVEGEFKDLIERKPTNAETPYLCVLDEYGYYAVEGFAVVPAQARSLGFSVIFAGQDLPAFQKASKEEAASIGANTNIKICMKLEDPIETWDFFMKTAGESYVTHVDSFQVDQGSVLGMYADAKGARLEKRARVDLLDLKEQREGEAHFFFKSKIVRGRFYYANPAPVKRMHLNHFLMIDSPTDEAVEQLGKTFETYQSLSQAKAGEWESIAVPENEEIERVMQLMQTFETFPPIQRAILVLNNFEERVQIDDGDIPSDFFAEVSQTQMEESEDRLNIFTPLHMSEYLEKLWIPDDPKFRAAILDRKKVRDQIEYLQRLCGKSSKQASSIGIELIGDMDRGTDYPPAPLEPPVLAPQITAKLREIVAGVSLKKKEAVESESD